MNIRQKKIIDFLQQKPPKQTKKTPKKPPKNKTQAYRVARAAID